MAFPCPVRPIGGLQTRLEGDRDGGAILHRMEPESRDGVDDATISREAGDGIRRKVGKEVVVLMNKRGRRFMEES